MTNAEIMQVAMQQSAIEMNCADKDFLSSENIVTISKEHSAARKYLKLPFFCNIVSYGSNIVASCDRQIAKFMLEYINRYHTEECFETPNLHLLTQEFEKYSMVPCFMAEYFLPNIERVPILSCKYETRILQPCDFGSLYTDEWSNALCAKRKHLDMLAVAAFDGDRIIGMAGCSADCEQMWQIGIDILPQYRGQGLSTVLTANITREILARGKVPFYCAAWSNIRSARNAIKSGFAPAWVELTSVHKNRAFEITK